MDNFTEHPSCRSLVLEGFMPGGVCDNIVAFFESQEDPGPGTIGRYKEVHSNIKRSTDIGVPPTYFGTSPIMEYVDELELLCREYAHRFKYADVGQDSWGIIENFNIQKYEPGEAYYKYHCENTGPSCEISRHLAFITYLNDVPGVGGETQFLYQDLKIKPKKGLTIIFPAHWTHTHKGIPSLRHQKYIATGWYSYKPEVP